MKKQQKSRYFISYFWDTTLEVVSKPHLSPNGCVAPQAGFASDFMGQGAAQASDKCSHTHVCCALLIGLRLALEPDLRF